MVIRRRATAALVASLLVMVASACGSGDGAGDGRPAAPTPVIPVAPDAGPIAGTLVVRSTVDGPGALFRAAGDDGAARRLAYPADGPLGDPVLAPDGTRLVFRVGGDDGGSVWVGDVDGGAARRMLGAGAGCATWSHDGEAVLASVRADGEVSWQRVPVEAPEAARPLALPFPAEQARCLVEVGAGRFVVERSAAQDGSPSLWTFGPGGDVLAVADLEGCALSGARADAAGARVAFVAACAGPGLDGLWVAPIDGSEPPTRVLEEQVTAVAWSPDGERLAYSRIPQGGDPGIDVEVRVTAVDGTDDRLVIPAPADSPTWR